MRLGCFVMRLVRLSSIAMGCFCMFLAACSNSETNTASLPPIITISVPTTYQGPSIGYATAYDSTSGQQRWRRTLTNFRVYPNGVRATSNFVYLLSGSMVMALDLATGKTYWQYQAPEANAEFFGSNALAGDTLYATEGIQGQPEDLVAFDATTGAIRWRFHTAAYMVMAATAQTAYMMLYSESEDGSVPQAVRAFSAHGNGTPLWTVVEHPMFSGESLALGSDGTVYVNDSDGIFAFDPATGAQRWHVANPLPKSQDPTGGAIFFTNNTIYAIFGGVALEALNATDGTVRWQASYSSPAYANDAQCLCSDGQHLALQRKSFGMPPIAVYDRATGQQTWNPEPAFGDLDVSARFTCDGQAIYISGAKGMSAYRLSDGTALWHTTTYTAVYGDLTTIWHGLLLTEGIDASRAGAIGVLALNISTGKEAWLASYPVTGSWPEEALAAIATVEA